MDAMINVENIVIQENVLRTSACEVMIKDTVGHLAIPSVLTVGMMLILTNTVLLFDYLWFYAPLKNISLLWRRHHCR
jgi:hypothetical protein